MLHTFVSPTVEFLGPAAVAAVWVVMTPRCSFLTSLVDFMLRRSLVLSIQFSEKNKKLVDSLLAAGGGVDVWQGPEVR
jgi:hypothetical protein